MTTYTTTWVHCEPNTSQITSRGRQVEKSEKQKAQRKQRETRYLNREMRDRDEKREKEREEQGEIDGQQGRYLYIVHNLVNQRRGRKILRALWHVLLILTQSHDVTNIQTQAE